MSHTPSHNDILFYISVIDATLYGGRHLKTESDVVEAARLFEVANRAGAYAMQRPCERAVIKTFRPPLPQYNILPVHERLWRDVEILKEILLPGGKCGGRFLTSDGLLVNTRQGWRVTKEVQRIVLEYNRHDYAWVNATHVEKVMGDGQ